ncbi:ankyrin repeat-containing domain protein [Colletotrichum godetiae]|uniref:Ankyrin repeat-containing domain protein n=1 Tax=Colletotrichum godetiae TaxID=1209918 RepID=A0AAJ0EN96_9PEZI|nr:ankyrin repeat-containing domain protein [Colletotrichum godetiae]KAK1657347.1 ankyrin repeat-containing domain protein [Colletotrichum godetiae]
MHQFPIVEFLLDAGAAVDDETYDHVWDFTFRQKCTDQQWIALSRIRRSKGRNWIGDQNFPLIHLIVFGISSKPLIEELEENPTAVYQTDAKGRTALDWATARAQSGDMELLIQYGSDVNTMDHSGRTTVLHAVDSHNYEALKMVLEAGANTNPVIPEGLHRSSPLTSASFGGLTEMVDLLLEHGARINTPNPEGRAALHTTIIRNNHEILRSLIKKCDGTCLRDLKLLPVIAQHADEQTRAILESSGQFTEI